MIKKITILYLACCVSGCLWVWYPPYSSFWNEDIWVHQNNNTSPSGDTVRECYAQALAPFETKVVGGLEIAANPDDQEKVGNLEGACLYQKGYRFNASWKYCYRFERTCKKWNKYRK
ncbi:hypothetical protein [Basilea psittacipulmonis]|uniref:Uncharacterized protein n=1 Tax=Basilea psittacipulmonis DSM 24701 TaxID=1072685 RepID=A0A077DJN4_9BURK|nr:hypothetical protein [Basilea psittacipulmonis]AIL33278.1 hypothetical protein IX83_08195 [Basilea psittacipulmonis DSM 24701]